MVAYSASSTILRQNIGSLDGAAGSGAAGSGDHHASSRATDTTSGGGNSNASDASGATAKDNLYILLDLMMTESGLTHDLVECCFPYDLMRTTFQTALPRAQRTLST